MPEDNETISDKNKVNRERKIIYLLITLRTKKPSKDISKHQVMIIKGKYFFIYHIFKP